MKRNIRILLLADSHLGFDQTSNPKIVRRRRGDDFARNYKLALEPAHRGEVDLVVHGGDVLYRSKVPPSLVIDAFTPLFEVADAGVPVFVAPGNHERSEIPYPLLAMHDGVHIFRGPQTFVARVGDQRVALSGFPFCREGVRERFSGLVEQTGYGDVEADLKLLVIHQAVEGATVGPVNFMFRTAYDVVCCSDVPSRFQAVLTGHIHRAQIIDKDLNDNSLETPVIYPGSIERTSFAEKKEAKGYFILEFSFEEQKNKYELESKFIELPTRPMVELSLSQGGKTVAQLETEISNRIAQLADDSIVRVKIEGDEEQSEVIKITAARLRELAPSTMNVELRLE